VVVVGPGGSRDALQVAPIYREAGMPQILPSATSDLLPAAGPWTFRLAPSDSAQGEFLGNFVGQQLHAQAVTLFYIPDEYGRGLSAGIVAALARAGVGLLDRVPVPVGITCNDPGVRNPYDDVVLSALRRGHPDVLVIAGAGWETTCIALAAGQRLPGVRIVAGDATELTPDQRRIAGAVADSIYLVAFWHATQGDSASGQFTAHFRRITGLVPNHGDAMWYDAAMLAATAIRTVGPDRGAIRDYLLSLGRARPPYPGVTGPIAFTPGVRRPLLMTRLTDSGTVVVAP
jgi:branched-chain amino acid transport system substrate-binding protein